MSIKMKVVYCAWRKRWCVIDLDDGYIMYASDRPAEARRVKRAWFRYYNERCDQRAMDIIDGKVHIK